MPYILIILSQQLLFFSLHNPFFCFSFHLFTCFTFHLKAYLPAIQQFCLRVSFFFVTQFKYFSYLSFFPSIFSSRCLSIYFSPTSILVFPVFLALSPLCHPVWPVILWSLKCGIFPRLRVRISSVSTFTSVIESSRVTHKRNEAWLLYMYSADRGEAYRPYTDRKYFWYCLSFRTIRGNVTIWRQNIFFPPQNFDLTSSISRWTVIKLQV
jgi:hypothetical protein